MPSQCMPYEIAIDGNCDRMDRCGGKDDIADPCHGTKVHLKSCVHRLLRLRNDEDNVNGRVPRRDNLFSKTEYRQNRKADEWRNKLANHAMAPVW